MTRNELLRDTLTALSEMNKEGMHVAEVLGEQFVVLPGVFSPKYFKDTAFFAEHLPVRGVDRMLEIGPGTGAVAITALLRGAFYADVVDINHVAVRNTMINAVLHGFAHVGWRAPPPRIEAICANVFRYDGPTYYMTAHDKNRIGTYDLIFWNYPFGFTQRRDLSMLERSVLDRNYVGLRKYVSEASQHLNPGGKVFLGFSFDIGDVRRFKEVMQETRCEYAVLKETALVQTSLPGALEVTYSLLELHPR